MPKLSLKSSIKVDDCKPLMAGALFVRHAHAVNEEEADSSDSNDEEDLRKAVPVPGAATAAAKGSTPLYVMTVREFRAAVAALFPRGIPSYRHLGGSVQVEHSCPIA
jgi:hypothetical protein